MLNVISATLATMFGTRRSMRRIRSRNTSSEEEVPVNLACWHSANLCNVRWPAVLPGRQTNGSHPRYVEFLHTEPPEDEPFFPDRRNPEHPYDANGTSEHGATLIATSGPIQMRGVRNILRCVGEVCIT